MNHLNRFIFCKGFATSTGAYLRNVPMDVAVNGGTVYLLAAPSSGDVGRIFRITGF